MARFCRSALLWLLFSFSGVGAAQQAADPEPVATFSIAAYDPATGDVGVAVQSKFFSVGPVVPWVESGVGAIATQAFANVTYGPRGLELLRLGLSPEQVVKLLTDTDAQRDRRQIGIVDVRGRAFSYTGPRCSPWAGGRSGQDAAGRSYAVQGNILAGEQVVLAMEQAFLTAPGELADRMLAALAAGQQAGGDSRGQQSAALIIMRPGAGYAGMNDRYVDLRVEDHPRPIEELTRLWGIKKAMGRIAEALRALREQDVPSARRALDQALQFAPDYPDLHYALARFHAQVGEAEKALDWLARAVRANPAFARAAAADPVFAPLRERPEFQRLMAP